MTGTSGTRQLKAKVMTQADESNGISWEVRLNPTNFDLDHPGNERWYLEFPASVAAQSTPPQKESDLERSTFTLNLNANAPVTECRQIGTQTKRCQTMTIHDFFAKGAKYQPGSYNNDTSVDANGNIGDPTSLSSLC